MHPTFKKSNHTVCCVVLFMFTVLWMNPFCSIWAVSYETKTNTNGCFARHQAFPLRIGIKTWAKATRDVVNQPVDKNSPTTLQSGCALGGAFGIGPFVEWKPLHGIGVQTGLLYAYHRLWSLQMRIKDRAIPTTNIGALIAGIKETFQETLENPSLHDRFQASIAPIALHTVHMPLHLRLYPEATRQLVLYAGGHMIVVIAGIRKAQRFTCNINLDDLKYTVAEEGIQESLKTIFEIPPDGMRDVPLDCTGQSVQWGWDFGFEFNGKAGFILGIYNLGLVFGYDCTNLFIKHD